MKHYTTPEQTAKLIELGFEKPKSSVECELPKGDWRIGQVGIRKAYSIGELIEMLDCVNETVHCRFGGVKANLVSTNSGYEKIGGELIDLLFDLCVKLKEDGVI
jgi:hypothetical protein